MRLLGWLLVAGSGMNGCLLLFCYAVEPLLDGTARAGHAQVRSSHHLLPLHCACVYLVDVWLAAREHGARRSFPQEKTYPHETCRRCCALMSVSAVDTEHTVSNSELQTVSSLQSNSTQRWAITSVSLRTTDSHQRCGV